MNGEIDVRPALETIGVPTLVLHRTGDRALPVEGARYLAEQLRRFGSIRLAVAA
jgi:pimeloyl-ACP methyl ester carboxylesterase